MKFFDESLSKAPLLESVRRKLIREKEENIRNDIKRLKQLRMVDAGKISLEQLIKMFHAGVPRDNFSKEMF